MYFDEAVQLRFGNSGILAKIDWLQKLQYYSLLEKFVVRAKPGTYFIGLHQPVPVIGNDVDILSRSSCFSLHDFAPFFGSFQFVFHQHIGLLISAASAALLIVPAVPLTMRSV